MNTLSRRRFLAGLSILTAALHVNAAVPQQTDKKRGFISRKRLCQRIDSVIGPWQSVEMVGTQCRQAITNTRLSPWSARFLEKLLDASVPTDKKALRDLRASYHLRVREDFRSNRVTQVNGYILSTTETETSRALQKILA